MSDNSPSAERLTAVESLLMHMQHELEHMNVALLAQLRDMDTLRKDVERLRGDLERLETPTETRDPKLEKPPHY
jgi:uncharacterized coiled-coil protein SlyX